VTPDAGESNWGSSSKDMTSFCIYARSIYHVFQYPDLENDANTWKFAEQVKCSSVAIYTHPWLTDL
jgi:hypothetical protein